MTGLSGVPVEELGRIARHPANVDNANGPNRQAARDAVSELVRRVEVAEANTLTPEQAQHLLDEPEDCRAWLERIAEGDNA